MRDYLIVSSLALMTLGVPLPTWAQTAAPGEPTGDSDLAICQTIEAAARANALPVDFFVRVIWQESRFQPDAIGPSTSGGEHAEGIAQFMPGTAVERGLYQPFNPIEALPKSGEFLAELRNEFGNLGLAAAAYNAGPQRVRKFLAGLRELPSETRTYVLAITGRSVEDWAALVKENSTDAGNNDVLQASRASTNCRDLALQLERIPRTFVTEWKGHKVPGWCRGLHHPNISVCGPVHEMEPMISAARPRSRVQLVRTSLR
jgi:hypothetical protein